MRGDADDPPARTLVMGVVNVTPDSFSDGGCFFRFDDAVRRALDLFDAIESVDRPRLARALAEEMERSGHRPDCFIQVNTGEEPQKSGIHPADADQFIGACRDDLGLPVRGLMCIPPQDDEPSLHFALLREIARRNGFRDLSMGMTADFDIAVRFGATHVRVGTALFGPRPPFNRNRG